MPPRLLSPAALMPLLLAVFVALMAAGGVGGVAAHASTPPPQPRRVAPPGYTLAVSSGVTATAGTRTQGVALCPKGTVPLSGGAAVLDPDTLVNLSDSFPNGSSWVVDITNASSTDNDVEVVATCARKVTHYKVVHGHSATLSPGGRQSFVATCPIGSKPLGGGITVASTDLSVNMAVSLPQNRQWRVDENNASATSAMANAFAICGSVPKYRVIVAAVHNVPAQSQVLVKATCPAPTVVMGGGAISGSLSVAVNLALSSMDEGFDWFAGINNTSDQSTGAAAVVVCGT
jgi:hypothetical protein